MSDKQLTCPLCGHEMTAIETYPGRGELYCGKCDLTIGGNEAKTPEELTFLADNSEIVRIKKENDILRAAREMAVEDAKSIVVKLSNARAENAKLRELLQDYHLYEHEDCHSCRYINECRADESGRCIAPMRLGERYREIGVEVDE